MTPEFIKAFNFILRTILRSFEIRTVYELSGYEIRTHGDAFTIHSSDFKNKMSKSNELNDDDSNYNFSFKLNFNINLIKNEFAKLTNQNLENKFELFLIDSCGNIIRQNF